MERKINIEISLSQNFNKITLGFNDELITFEDENDFKDKIKEKFESIKLLITEQYENKS